MKKCLKCDSDGPFNKNKTKKDGFSSYCKACDRIRSSAADKKRTERNRMERLKFTNEDYILLRKRSEKAARSMGHPEWAPDIIARYMEKIARGHSPNTKSIAVDMMREKYGDIRHVSQETLAVRKAIERPVSMEIAPEGAFIKQKSEMDLVSEVLEYREQLGERRWLMFVLYTIFDLPFDCVGVLFGTTGPAVKQTIASAGEFIKKQGYSF